MTARLHYPVFVVVNRNGVVIVAIDGSDCVMLFHYLYNAERQIAKLQETHSHLGRLHALPVPSEDELREGLKELPPSVTCAVWDPTGQPSGFKHVCLDDLLLQLHG